MQRDKKRYLDNETSPIRSEPERSRNITGDELNIIELKLGLNHDERNSRADVSLMTGGGKMTADSVITLRMSHYVMTK